MRCMEPEKRMQTVFAKAWKDKGFKTRLLRDPAAMLEQEGVYIPDGLHIRVIEDTEKSFTLRFAACPK